MSALSDWGDAQRRALEKAASDAALLAKLGYADTLFRGFSAVDSFAFCFTSVAVLSSLAATLSTGLTNGGPSVVIYGWLAVSALTILTGAVMAEICSSFPSAGSVYHWSGVLASPRWGPFAAYVSGWFNLLGNAAGCASFAFTFASALAAAIDVANFIPACALATEALVAACAANVNDDDVATCLPAAPCAGALRYPACCFAAGYDPLLPNVGAQVGIAMAVSLLWALWNTCRMDVQGKLNSFAMYFQFASVLVIAATLFACAARANPGGLAPSAFVWGAYFNGSGFTGGDGIQVYVGLTGLLTALFSFSGYDAGAHAAEETRNSERATPAGIIATCASVAACGVLLITAFLYSIPYSGVTITADMAAANPGGLAALVGMDLGVFNILTAQPAPGNPVVNLFYSVAGPRGGLGLACLLVINVFFAGFASLTVTSRIAYAMARDGALPFSAALARVGTNWIPTNTIFLVFAINVLLLLLPLATLNTPAVETPIAFFAVTGLTTIGYQISYAVPIFLRARLADEFPKGPVHLGRWSVPAAWVAGVFLTATSLIFFWPITYPVTEVRALAGACLRARARGERARHPSGSPTPLAEQHELRRRRRGARHRRGRRVLVCARVGAL